MTAKITPPARAATQETRIPDVESTSPKIFANGRRVRMATLLANLGIRQIARTLAEPQAKLDAFRRLQRAPAAPGDRPDDPAKAYRFTAKDVVVGTRAAGHFRLRYDIADKKGAITMRRAGRLYHLKIGATHARRRALAIADEQEVMVVALDTGEIFSTHLTEPDRR